MMERLEWLAIAVLALLACAVVLREAPGREPYPMERPIPGGETVERQAEEDARAFGVELQSWKRYFRNRWNGHMQLAYGQGLVEEAWQLRHPGSYTLHFFGADQERCEVEVDLTGKTVGFDCRNPTLARNRLEGSAEEAAAAREVAIREYHAHWRRWHRPDAEEDLGFRLTADAAPERDGYAFEWTSQPDQHGLLAWKLSFLIRADKVIRYRLRPEPLEPLRVVEQERNRRLDLLRLCTVVLGFVAMATAPVLALLNLYRGRLPWSFVVRAASALSVILALDFALGDRYDALHIALRTELAELVLIGIQSILILAVAISVIAAGRATRVSSDFRRWLGLEDFLRLKWNKASVTRSFVVALLVAPLWMGISYAGLALVEPGMTEGVSWQASVLRAPPIGGIYSGRSLAILVVVLLAFPLIKANLRNRKAQAALAVVVAAMGSVYTPIAEYPLGLLIAEAFLHGLLLVYTYHRFGVLAATLGAILAPTIGRAFVYVERGEPDLQMWGAGVLVLVALFFVVRMVLDARNPDWESEQRLSEKEFEALRRERERRMVTRRERLVGEFALAEQAQQRMLPSGPPPVPGLGVAAVCLPAQQVGGDLFDYLQLADGRWGFCVADVSGKGVSAALYMTMVKGLLNSAQSTQANIQQMVLTLNEHVYRSTSRRDFVTMTLAAIEPKTHRLEVLRAGHPPLLHVSADSKTRFVAPPGMGLGMAPSSIFGRNLRTESIEILPGDIVVLYSDGVTEAMNPLREEFGETRMTELVQASAYKTADGILGDLLQGIRAFQAGAPVHDDITLVVLKAAHPERTQTDALPAG